MKKYFFGIIFLFLFPYFSHASVVVNEIMYAPSGSDDKHEWIEVQNTGTDSVDLSKYFLQTDGVSSSYHSIEVASGYSPSLPSGGYAVIAQDAPTFKVDQGGAFSGYLFDSSWNDLTNSSGKTIAISDSSKNPVDQVIYDVSIGNGTDDGNSLQKTSSGVWVAGSPTPGAKNIEGQNSQNINQGESNQVNNQNSPQVQSPTDSSQKSIQQKPVAPPHIQALIDTPNTVTTNVSSLINLSVVGLSGEKIYSGGFHLNFGDGNDYSFSSIKNVEHVYKFPGTYVINFEYRSNPYSGSLPDAVARVSINVIDPTISIQKVGDDGSVVLFNSGMREVDISNWVLRSAERYWLAVFKIPQGTILLPGKNIYLPKELTNFSNDDVLSLELSTPINIIVSKYKLINITQNNIPTPDLISVKQIAKNVNVKNNEIIQSKNINKVSVTSNVLSESLSANAEKSISQEPTESFKKEGTKTNSILPFIIGVLGIIVLSIFAVRYTGSLDKIPTEELKNKRNQNESEAIAEDIHIIE